MNGNGAKDWLPHFNHISNPLVVVEVDWVGRLLLPVLFNGNTGRMVG